MVKSNRIYSFFWRMIANGLTYDHDLEELRKIILLNIIIFLGILFLSLLGALAFVQHDVILGSMDAGMVFFLIGLFIYFRISMNIGLVSKVGVAAIGIFYFVIFFNGGVHQTAFVWHYTYPLIAVFLLGNKHGTFATFILLFFAVIVFVFAKSVSWLPVYKLDLILRYIPSYITTYLFTFLMEKTRSIIQSRLKEANQKQHELINKLETARQDLEEMAIKDELTGLHNRRYFNEIFSLVCKRSQRFGEVIAALMIDIDYFKNYNDRYGHLAGDEILKEFSRILSDSIRRKTDFVFRYGGEEFTIILTKTNRHTTEEVAGKIIQNLADAKLEHSDSPTGFLTTSLGIALAFPDEMIAEDELVRQADRALYQAKENGRNQYIFAEKN